MSVSAREPKRVAIVGAGPAGVYAADLLLRAERPFEVQIDLFERLPAPYGLVRYGVAPDHPHIKHIVNALRTTLDASGVRLFGNVEFGSQIGLEDLQAHYDAVIFATGALDDASLRVPGENLSGSFGASAFVGWYDGHPDFPLEWPLDATDVAVIGNGNVALDITRMLVRSVQDLAGTDIPENVEQDLGRSRVSDVHVFGRRGPGFAKFSPLETRELGQIPGVDVLLDPEDFAPDPDSDAAFEANNQRKVLRRIFTEWLGRTPTGASRRVHLHFRWRPAEILGDGRVTGLRVERTAVDDRGALVGTGEFREFPVGQVYRAVGYTGSALSGVPFDADRGVIPNSEGRVLGADGSPIPGEYVTGWIRRGPVGLIGSTKSDALQTITHLVEDLGAGRGWVPQPGGAEAIPALLSERKIEYTTLEGWHRLDAYEHELGAAQGRDRIKVVSREEMVRHSRG